jgi:hypothetical protein
LIDFVGVQNSFLDRDENVLIKEKESTKKFLETFQGMKYRTDQDFLNRLFETHHSYSDYPEVLKDKLKRFKNNSF